MRSLKWKMKKKRNKLISLAGLDKEHYNKPLSVYIHIPFCLSKCPYCAFYSKPVESDEVELYLEALNRDLKWWGSFLSRGKIRAKTLYIGGGTPTILSPLQWETLISLLENTLELIPGCEISVEANPGSLTKEHLNLWKDWSLTRVSLGVQSLHDDELKWLGRPHDSDTARKALSEVKEAGFDLSADLIFGLSGQSLRKWYYSLREILRYSVEHLSLYQLMLEQGTPWGERPPEGVFNGYPHYRFAQWYLARKGLNQYEVASFSRYGKWCRHNIAYWFQKDVLALGPSAWGYFKGVRYWNHKDLGDYCSSTLTGKGAARGFECLDEDQKIREAVILATRTNWGFLPANFYKKFNRQVLDSILSEWKGLPKELFSSDPSRIALSSKGMRVGNAIWERII